MTDHAPRPPKFDLGTLLCTPGALRALEDAGQSPFEFLRRHVAGDWGELSAADCDANDQAIADEGNEDRRARVLSAYRTRRDVKVWVITEADRSATTILLPEEY